MLCLFSCCGEKYKLNLPSAHANSGQINLIKIYVDEEFSPIEEFAIHKSFVAWRKVSGESIRFDYSFKHIKPGKLESYFWSKQYDDSIFVWRADSKNISAAFDEKYASYAGFWDLHGNIVIFADRIDHENNELYNVMVHEVGHMLGLKHIVYEKSVMQPKSDDISNCITKDDSYRLCLIYGCNPNPECD